IKSKREKTNRCSNELSSSKEKAFDRSSSQKEFDCLFEEHGCLQDVNEEVKVLEREVRKEEEVEVESSKREGESLEKEVAKKQKMEQETKELKKPLQIVPNDKDDVYTDATLLASKISIIDYKIHTERNRLYFKTIRADGNHRLFMSFKPKNYSDDYLLNTLKIMFEKPNVEANVWKDQKGKYGLAKVKSWKLIESCGVHWLTLSTTHTFLLVERMYPLTHFTLEQMINDVKLKVEDESEMSLKLLRFPLMLLAWVFCARHILRFGPDGTAKSHIIKDDVAVRRMEKIDVAFLATKRVPGVLKPPPGINLAALWHQQSSALPQTRSLTSPELMDLCTRLSNKVLDLESKVIDLKSSFTHKIAKLKDSVHKLKEENRILKEKSFKSAKSDIAAPAKAYNLDLQHSKKVLSMQDTDEEEPTEVKEVLEVVTAAKLIKEVLTTATLTTTTAQVLKPSAPRRRRGVIIQDPEETAASVIVRTEVKPKDKGKGILIEEPKPLKRQAQIKQDEAFARQLEADLNANINWNDAIEQVKKSERQNNEVMRYQALKRKPLTESQARKNMMIYLKNMAGFKMNFFKGMTYKEEVIVQEKEIEEESSKRHCESLEQDIARKQRMDEEAKELKRHLQIMANDDDVEYLETLWKLVKERFETTKPKNFSDDFLLNILKIMFEKPDIEANQMLDNVRLEVEEESEMSLELLRLVRRQLNEGYVLE
nr:hypothetical protein [Tanacetum cinerariifolium]